MTVLVPIPLAPDDENLEHPYIDAELTTHNFAQASKKILNRVYNQVLADGATLASGRKVDSPSLFLEWILEQVAADTYVIPAEADVKLNVQYGAGGTQFTGSYSP